MNFFKKLVRILPNKWTKLFSTLSANRSKKTEKAPQEKAFRLFPEIQNEDVDFIKDTKAALLTKRTTFFGFILYSVIGLIIIVIIWAYFAPIDQMTLGEGKVIPSSEVKVIQSLDGGIIATLDVEEGAIIKKNQVLLTFDDTRYKSDYEQGKEKYFSLIAIIARLNAETQGLDHVTFPKELVENSPDLVVTENKLFEARKLSLTQELGSLQKNYDLAEHVIKIYEPLLKTGVVPKIDYYKAQQSANEIQHNIFTLQDKYRQDALTDLNQRKADLAVITESLTSLKDKMQKTTIRSPVNGIVKKIYIHTIGAVIQSAQPIMEILPIEDTLLIQVKIKPSDIAFISVGQEATVKISAYDYSIYGSLNGKVEYISVDAIDDSKVNNSISKDELNYYVVNVRTIKSYLGSAHYKLPIMAGMNATVYIKTGKKTVLEYILKPMIKAKEESLRER
jgi:adhesin transport system membrane fusion protein